MRLKSIKLAGFKSFVDPTTVTFPSNLCAVVGPNGCGKSNIIDAVRWVMGESSAKNLRGEAMTDVIFNGSGSRKPVGQASIELIFDNSDGTLVGEYAGFNEISIKRKVTREGQNIYYLNNSKCRRRDITDIFLGTGLGPRSYAIIEQGMISRLIEAKPEELRVYIEEAAGISKYKERRKDTESRMRRTQENLERLTDLRDELERQLSRLERQAQAAEKYTEFKKVERDLRGKLLTLRHQALAQQSQVQVEKIRESEMSVEAAVTEHVHHDSAIEKHRTKYTELSDAFNQVQARFYSIGNEIARIEQSIQHANDRERQLNTDIQETEKLCVEASEHLSSDQQKIDGWQAELLEIEPELELIKSAEEESSAILLEAEDSMHHWQQDWDSFNQKAAEPRQQAEVQQSRIKYLEQVQQRLLERITKLEEELSTLVIGDAEVEIQESQESLSEIELSIEEKNNQLDEGAHRITELREEIQTLVDKKSQANGELQTAKGRYASLEALQQAAMGQASGTTQEWIERQGLQSFSRLGEKLAVEQGWEKAVETVLGKSLQAVCGDIELNKLAESISHDIEITLISAQKPSAQFNESSLLSKVTAEIDVAPFLQHVQTADTLKDALHLQSQLTAEQSVITREGVWLGPNWIRVNGDEDTSAGIFARKQEIASLEHRSSQLESDIVELTERHEKVKAELNQVELQRENLRREVTQLSKQQADVSSELSRKRAKVEQISEGRERTTRELQDAKDQMQSESENLVDARANLQTAIDAMETDTAEREVLLNRRDSIRGKLDEARQKARHDKDKSHALAMRHQSTKTQLESVHQGIERLQEQLTRLQERKSTLLKTIDEIKAPIDDYKLELEAQLEKRVSVEDELTEARREVESVEAAMREAEQQRQKVEQVLNGLRAELEKSRIQLQTIEVKRENLKQQLDEDSVDINAVVSSLTDDINESSLEKELEQIANKISRLGAINLAAIEEYQTESERKNYLDAQNTDLCEALETLEEAIKKIDRETRTRFKETYDQVNGGLQELFPKVFGGGHAYLELTGDDLLETGIAIMARPPGKKNSTIHLLSGGEKALTAIALVFSIFRLNPAPFCMLDEVDAPLDDANVGRYARLVEEMSQQVQFIYITHNKIAMEMAHQLMGVTMHEAGVSRMVTVDVEEAAELAAV